MSTHTDAQSEGLSREQLAQALGWVQAGRVATIERFPYLDAALSAMIPVPVPGLGTVATDARWRFYYDPERTLRQTADGELCDVIVDWYHECGHQLRDHCSRWADLSQPQERHRHFNVAGDAFINRDIQELGLRLLRTDVTFASLPGRARRQVTTEAVYFELLAAEQAKPQVQSGESASVGGSTFGTVGSWPRVPPATKTAAAAAAAADVVAGLVGSGKTCGSGAGGPSQPWELTDDEDGSVSPSHGDSVREVTAEKLREHVRTQGSEAVPNGLRNWAEALLDPLVDWRRELRTVVSKALGRAAGRRDYSWSRPARRRVPGYVLPGMVAPAPPQVAAVVDTSGSMSVEDLTQCLSDVASLARSAGGVGVQVLPCDMSAGPTSLVRHRSDVSKIALTGGGGTSMSVGIEAAALLRPKPSVIITLTDGYTDWPAEPPTAAATAKYVVVLIGDPPTKVGDAVPEWMHVVNAPASRSRTQLVGGRGR